MRIRFHGVVAAFALLMTIPSILGHADEYRYFHENVLGTSLELRIEADHQESAVKAEAKLLHEIDRLSDIYSEYDSASEFARLLQAPVGDTRPISSELADTLKICESWTEASQGAFNPAAAAFSQTWQRAQNQKMIPQIDDIAETVKRVRKHHWQINSSGESVTRTSDVPLSLNAIAKGVILDRVVNLVLESDAQVTGVLLNIGGDLRIAGKMSAEVAIANPVSDAIGSQGLKTVVMTNGAIATSGQSERFFEVEGRKYSHLIDPRTGNPVSQTMSASVIAKDACTADAVATICSVLSISESLSLVDSLPGVECFLITAAGVVATSANWPHDNEAGGTTESEQKMDHTGHDLLVEFEIAKSDNSRRYRRPYVAVWIEDAEGFPVKTLSLFLMKNNPGPRWHRDLRRWYSDDQVRRLVDEVNLIETVSKPTRNPGQYKVSWDGKDDHGKLVTPGEYTLLLEAAREHGTYQLSKHQFTLGKSFEVELKPNVEISAARIRYTVK